MSYRRLAGVQSTPRVMRGAPVRHGSMFDVPLMERDLGAAEIEMPEECARAGEILLAPGVCGPDPRRPLDPYAAPTKVVQPGTRLTVKSPAAASASSVAGSMSRTTMLLAGLGAVGLIYYLGKRK